MSGEPPAKRTENEDFAAIVAFEKLTKICEEIEELHAREGEEIVEISSQCNKDCQPLYNKRAKLIRDHDQETGTGFWYESMINHPRLYSLFTDKTEEVLIYLSEVEIIEEAQFSQGFTIRFTWDGNPYFEEKVMEKRTQWDKTRKKNCNYPVSITWKKGMNIFEKKIQKDDIREKSADQADKAQFSQNGNDEIKYNDPFFEWLTTYTENENECEISDVFRDGLWINPYKYFILDLKQKIADRMKLKWELEVPPSSSDSGSENEDKESIEPEKLVCKEEQEEIDETNLKHEQEVNYESEVSKLDDYCRPAKIAKMS